MLDGLLDSVGSPKPEDRRPKAETGANSQSPIDDGKWQMGSRGSRRKERFTFCARKYGRMWRTGCRVRIVKQFEGQQ